MRLLLLSGLYSAILCLASGLKCFEFNGLPDNCKQKQVAVTCDSKTQQLCSSSLISYSGALEGVMLVKGCSMGNSCNKTTTGVLRGVESSETILCCNTELCNEDLTPDLGDTYRTECLACHGSPSICGGGGLPNLRCEASQRTCIEVSITTAFSQDIHHTMLKGCSNSSFCPGLSAFSNGQNPVSYSCSHRCCNGSLCNHGDFAVADSESENGLECYSRSSRKGRSGTMKCKGQMTQCTDLIGTSPDKVVMSGCATPAFCEGLYPQFPIPGWQSTVCCSKSLCNHASSSSGSNGIKH